MAKKNMDILLGNILGSAAIKPQDRHEEPATPLPANDASTPSTNKTSKEASEDSWRHFSFICSKSLVDKVQAIAHKEGFTIRSFMEYVMKQGIEAYESKHGKVKKVRSKEIHEVMEPCGYVYMWTCPHVDMNTYRPVYVETLIQNISNQLNKKRR